MKNVSKFWVFPFFIIFALFASSAFAGEWKVKSGDNLSKIASNYPGVTYRDICNANSHMFKVKGCKHIEPGWLLVIPEVGDCFDATMTVASKQKAFDDWNRKVVSNYQDGKPDCNFEELSEKSEPILIDKELLERIEHIDDTLTNHLNMKTEVFVFGTLGNSSTVGVGGLLRYPSDYLVSYQFSKGEKGYANQLLFGKYFTPDLAFAVGPRVENNSNNNSDALGMKISILYIPKITDSIFGFVEVGISGMRVKEHQINGSPNLTLNGNTLSVNNTVVREENSYWDNELGFSIGFAYKF